MESVIYVIHIILRGQILNGSLCVKEHYGKPGSERVHRVIKVFRDLDLVEEYRQYEIKCYKAIMKKITKLPESIPALYFSETLDLILKREK